MRQISRIDFLLLFACVCIVSGEICQAQQSNKTGARPAQPAAERVPTQKAAPLGSNAPGGPAAGAPRQAAAAPKQTAARPAVAPEQPVANDLSPQLEKILKRWEEESAKIKNLHGTQSRSEFNHIFAVEKVTKGPFFLETPDKGRIDMLTYKFPKGAVSKRANKETQEPYTLETDESNIWICSGDAILQLSEKDKTYQRAEIPKEQRGTNIVHSPLPFLFGMKAEEAKTRFTLELLKETDEAAYLKVVPRLEQDRQNYTRAAIKLDKKKYLPAEVRMYDGDNEVIYTFESVSVNSSDFKQRFEKIFGMGDPYHPNLKGYTVVLPAEAQQRPQAPVIPVRATAPQKDQKKTATPKAAGNPTTLR